MKEVDHQSSEGGQLLRSLGSSEILNTTKLALFCFVKCSGNLILQIYELAKVLHDRGVTVERTGDSHSGLFPFNSFHA
jgi:hypothetical protein